MLLIRFEYVFVKFQIVLLCEGRGEGKREGREGWQSLWAEERLYCKRATYLHGTIALGGSVVSVLYLGSDGSQFEPAGPQVVA